MTRDEIIRLAREAGLENYGPTPSAPESYGVFVERMERFAALVAAHEREACAKVCELLVKEFKDTGGRPYDWKSQGAEDCAYEIRARGKP